MPGSSCRMSLLAVTLLLCWAPWTAARPARFVVETNSVLVKEPDSIAGTYEAAIGDVSEL